MTGLNKNILNMIRESEGHLTAEQAFLLAKSKNIDVSMASIYRILGKLASDGYIKRICIAGSPDIFDKTISNHDHLICSKCGRVIDVCIPDLKKTIEEKVGFEISDYELSIKYVCEHCRKKED